MHASDAYRTSISFRVFFFFQAIPIALAPIQVCLVRIFREFTSVLAFSTARRPTVPCFFCFFCMCLCFQKSVRLYLCDWGFNTAAQRARGEANERITLIGTDDIAGVLAPSGGAVST